MATCSLLGLTARSVGTPLECFLVTNVLPGLLRSLQHLGMRHVMDAYLQGLDADAASVVRDYQYEAAWQSANWNLDTPAR